MEFLKKMGGAATAVCVILALSACREDNIGETTEVSPSSEGAIEKKKLGSAVLTNSSGTAEGAKGATEGQRSLKATALTLDAGFTGPIVFTSGNETPVEGGLVRVGTFSAIPASASVEDINAVFQEFGVYSTSITDPKSRLPPEYPSSGRLGMNINNPDAVTFRGKQIYVWVFSTRTAEPSPGQEHGVFTLKEGKNTVVDPPVGPNIEVIPPDPRDDWFFPDLTSLQALSRDDFFGKNEPDHLHRTIRLQALFHNLDDSITPGIVAKGQRLILTPVPE